MSLWGVIVLLITLLQFVYEYRKKIQVEPLKKKSIDMQVDVKEISEHKKSSPIKRKHKKITVIDREKEILTSEFQVDRKKLVSDFIMAEVLSEAKSKRKKSCE